MAEPILTYELKAILTKIKNDLVSEYPIQVITLDYLILQILNTQNSDVMVWLSTQLMSSSIMELRELSIQKILHDSASSILQDKNSIRFSDDYDKLAMEISSNGSIVPSKKMFAMIVVNDKEYSTLLMNNGITIDTLKSIINGSEISVIEQSDVAQPQNTKQTHAHKKERKKQFVSETMNGGRIIPEEANIVESNCINLVRNASKHQYDNIIGYDDVIDDIFKVLGKYDRNTVALIGPHGSGRTSVIERMAYKIYQEDCPNQFKDKYIMKLTESLNSIMIKEMDNRGKYIAIIDNVEILFANRDVELMNQVVLSQLFNASNISTIIITTEDAYSKHIASKPDFARLIQKVNMPEPTDDEMFQVIKSAIKPYQTYNNVFFQDNVIKTAIKLSKRFIQYENCPQSALNILDAAAASLRISNTNSNHTIILKNRLIDIENEKMLITNSGNANDFDRKDMLVREEIQIKQELSMLSEQQMLPENQIQVSENDIKIALSKITNIPINDMDDNDKEKLKKLNQNILDHVVGQDEAVETVCRAVKRQRVGLSNPNKPIVMMFVGTTGTGKSFLAKRLAKEMFGDEKKIVRLDMSEYSDKTSATKLYGASAGYIGYENGGILTEAIQKNNRCVLLLDEIEKASDEVFNVFLQVFDEGRLTDNKGVTVDFKNVIIIMTSNVGAKNVSEKMAHIGFGKNSDKDEDKEIILKAIKKTFKPEFINRIDNICYFNKLTDDNLYQIIVNEVSKIHIKLQDIGYDCDDTILHGKLIDDIFNEVKKESEYGARPILREIQCRLEDKLTDYIIDNNVEQGHIFTYNDIY